MPDVRENLMKNFQVSVIIPLYNKERTIKRSLNSVVNQTFQNFEIIVVDDGSTDGGADIVRQYNDSRIRLVWQENAGPGAARNRGVSEAQYDLVSFLDADDEWLKEYLEECIHILESNLNCTALVCSYYQGCERKDMTRMFFKAGVSEGSWTIDERMSGKKLRLMADAFNASMVMVYKDSLMKYGGFYSKERCTYGEDTYLWLQILLNENIYWHLKPLVWWHTDFSELGLGRSQIPPLKPVLTNPKQLCASCPSQYKHLLEDCIKWYTILSARQRLSSGIRTAFSVTDQYMTKNKRSEYLFIRLGIVCFSLYRRVVCFASYFRKTIMAKIRLF